MYKAVGRNPLPKGANGIPLAGWWYSAPEGGQCAAGQRLGTAGCTWRVLRTKKVIKAACMYERVDAAVEAHDKTCFSACGLPWNTSSTCYMECYEQAMGNMTALQLTAGWHTAFDNTEPASGGCPPLTD